MVQNVSFDPETKVLTIAFNTDAGIENIEVDLASLVDAYTAGSGITISKNVIPLQLLLSNLLQILILNLEVDLVQNQQYLNN